MKVNSAELKTRLGHYLRSVERSGVPLEVTVRNQPVAILAPHGGGDWSGGAADAALPVLALRRLGLIVEPAASRGKPPVLPPPAVAGDGRGNVVTVESSRKERDW